jgi:hypothetical protein
MSLNRRSLFVTPNEFNLAFFGGAKLSKYYYEDILSRNIDLDLLVCNKKNVFKKNFYHKILLIIDNFFLFSGNNNFYTFVKFIFKLRSNKYDLVFFDGSYFGINIFFLKLFYPKIEIVTLFHNIEFKFNMKGVVYNKIFLLKIFSSYFNDIVSIKNSSKILTISENDYSYIQKKTNNPNVFLFFPDLYNICSSNNKTEINHKSKYFYDVGFIGSGFHGNLILIDKFINEIKNIENIRLHIYGYGFQQKIVKKYSQNGKIFFHGSFKNEVDVVKNHHIFLNSGIIESGLQIKSLLYMRYNKIILSYSPIFLKLNYSDSVILIDENLDFNKLIDINSDTVKLYKLFHSSFDLKKINL